jgi:hypothetical protein
VTTALGVATSQTDSGAFASDNDEALGRCGLKDLVTNHTRSDLECRALVGRTRPVLVLDIIQVVSPYREGTGTG